MPHDIIQMCSFSRHLIFLFLTVDKEDELAFGVGQDLLRAAQVFRSLVWRHFSNVLTKINFSKICKDDVNVETVAPKSSLSTTTSSNDFFRVLNLWKPEWWRHVNCPNVDCPNVDCPNRIHLYFESIKWLEMFYKSSKRLKRLFHTYHGAL